MRNKVLLGAAVLAVYAMMLALAGCGGGSSPSPSSPSSPPPPATTFSVGGNVSGLGANESVTLLNNGADALIVSGNSGFTFSTNQNTGSAYAVTVQSHTPGIACSVGNGSGSVGSSKVTGITVSCGPGTETNLYSFGIGASDGMYPGAGLIMDSAGNLYGTTYEGGAIGVGTVFKISASGAESALYSFAGPLVGDGANPEGNLIMDSAGNLYGTTSLGGTHTYGTVFKISPGGTESVLHSFSGGPTDGAYPQKGLVIDSAGNLYGTTSNGGSNGVVFKISADGTESIVHTFTGIDGGNPRGNLIMDSVGNLYGTTTSGGTATVINSGEVFKVSPAGTLSVLHYFTGGITPTITDGGYPRAGLVIDSDGNLYGTTSSGGSNNNGTVFKISADGTEIALHSFAGATTDGNEPIAGLIMDNAGNLYGTTDLGGANDTGAVFKID
jgi:uncharacterized repeat protein (TIGR03803 family)